MLLGALLIHFSPRINNNLPASSCGTYSSAWVIPFQSGSVRQSVRGDVCCGDLNLTTRPPKSQPWHRRPLSLVQLASAPCWRRMLGAWSALSSVAQPGNRSSRVCDELLCILNVVILAAVFANNRGSSAKDLPDSFQRCPKSSPPSSWRPLCRVREAGTNAPTHLLGSWRYGWPCRTGPGSGAPLPIFLAQRMGPLLFPLRQSSNCLQAGAGTNPYCPVSRQRAT